MLVPPGNPTSATTAGYQILNQKTNANTITTAWDVTVSCTSLPRLSLS